MREAVEAYSLAIGLDGAVMAAYTNRAQAYLKLKAWDYAITDCDSALRVAEAAEEAAAATAGAATLPLKVAPGEFFYARGKARGTACTCLPVSDAARLATSPLLALS